jgi:hypothetical protein
LFEICQRAGNSGGHIMIVSRDILF